MPKDKTGLINSNSNAQLYISLLVAMFIWGISWPSAKIVGRYADAELLMFWRFLIGAISMLPIMYLLNIKANFQFANQPNFHDVFWFSFLAIFFFL